MTGWLDAGGRRVPFTLLGGYLGAGKTTIVNHVLATAEGRRIVVLVNDVGAVNVDAALIANHDGPTLTLTNGCVCCALDDGFAITLETVRALPERPDHVLMELSGVGEPARLVSWASTAGFRLDGVVVAVDAEQFADQLARRYVGDTVDAQVRSADLLVLTKGDLVDDTGPAEQLIAERSSVPMLHAVAGRVPIDAVLGIGGSTVEHVPHPNDVDVVTRSIDVAGIDLAGLDALLAALPSSTVRVKGLVAIEGEVQEVHVVGRRRSVRLRPDLRTADDRLVIIEVPG